MKTLNKNELEQLNKNFNAGNSCWLEASYDDKGRLTAYYSESICLSNKNNQEVLANGATVQIFPHISIYTESFDYGFDQNAFLLRKIDYSRI